MGAFGFRVSINPEAMMRLPDLRGSRLRRHGKTTEAA
jgi:hypothetical protein